MTVEWSDGHTDALDEIGEILDRVTERYHRLRDSLRNPPRTKKARDLVRGDVVQYGRLQRVVTAAWSHPDGRRHVCWDGFQSCNTYHPNTEIALAHSHDARCYGDDLEPVCGVTS